MSFSSLISIFSPVSAPIQSIHFVSLSIAVDGKNGGEPRRKHLARGHHERSLPNAHTRKSEIDEEMYFRAVEVRLIYLPEPTVSTMSVDLYRAYFSIVPGSAACPPDHLTSRYHCSSNLLLSQPLDFSAFSG